MNYSEIVDISLLEVNELFLNKQKWYTVIMDRKMCEKWCK